MKQFLATVATQLARPASFLVGTLRGTTRVRPLSRSFYTLTVPGLDGQPVDLERFAGRVTLVVNVASECGFTPQYAGLQALRDEYGIHGFEVLGFPSNEFGGQEPGSPEQIQRFCTEEYRVTFPLFEKVRTKPGADQSTAYRLLGESGHLPAWNFYKFLIGRDGQVAAVFPTNVRPTSTALRNSIERAMAAPQPAVRDALRGGRL
jgi:glutathione peroxidase